MKLARLLEHRRRAGLSQAELAERSGVQRAAISKFETMKREAQPSTARALAEALGVEVAEMYYSADIERPQLGREHGNALRAAREQSGYQGEIALLRRFAEEVEEGPTRSMYEVHQREAEFLQALEAVDMTRMPKGLAVLILSYAQLVGTFLQTGVRVPGGLARSFSEALEREAREERGEDHRGS